MIFYLVITLVSISQS